MNVSSTSSRHNIIHTCGEMHRVYIWVADSQTLFIVVMIRRHDVHMLWVIRVHAQHQSLMIRRTALDLITDLEDITYARHCDCAAWLLATAPLLPVKWQDEKLEFP